MKKAPCVRLASRIKPKISEKPDESRNNRPPSDRLLRPWMIQNCISCASSDVCTSYLVSGIIVRRLDYKLRNRKDAKCSLVLSRHHRGPRRRAFYERLLMRRGTATPLL